MMSLWGVTWYKFKRWNDNFSVVINQEILQNFQLVSKYILKKKKKSLKESRKPQITKYNLKFS